MIPIEVKILRKNSNEVAWPDIPEAKEGTCSRVVILEKGTVGGQPVVAFDIKTPDGHFVLQLTEFLLSGIMGALIGAKQNWDANPE